MLKSHFFFHKATAVIGFAAVAAAAKLAVSAVTMTWSCWYS